MTCPSSNSIQLSVSPISLPIPCNSTFCPNVTSPDSGIQSSSEATSSNTFVDYLLSLSSGLIPPPHQIQSSSVSPIDLYSSGEIPNPIPVPIQSDTIVSTDSRSTSQLQTESASSVLRVRKKADAFQRKKIQLMKETYDKKVEERTFEIGDVVGICLSVKEKRELPQSLRVANIPAKVVSKEPELNGDGHTRYVLCTQSHRISSFFTQEVLIPLVSSDSSYSGLDSFDLNNWGKLPALPLSKYLRNIKTQHISQVSGITPPPSPSTRFQKSSSPIPIGSTSAPCPIPTTSDERTYKCKVCNRPEYARNLLSCTQCKSRMHDYYKCKRNQFILKNEDLLFCSVDCSVEYNHVNYPDGITSIDGVNVSELISQSHSGGQFTWRVVTQDDPATPENIPVIDSEIPSTGATSSPIIINPSRTKRKRAPHLVETERKENHCCVCDIEIQNYEEFFNCFRCGLKMHHVRDCGYPLLQKKIGEFRYCSFKCERDQAIYEVKIVEEKLFKRENSFIKKYSILFSNNSKLWRNAHTIDTMEEYRKMVNDFHRLNHPNDSLPAANPP